MSSYQLGRYDIKDVQDKMLGLLVEFDRICRKYDLRYALDGGTMLGAVRHKGFIPWDDDADVMMLREDYDIFIKVSSQELKAKNMTFQCIENTPGYPYSFGKMFDLSTYYLENRTKNQEIAHSVYIDVFPMDYVDEKHNRYHSSMVGHYDMLRNYHLGISHGPKSVIGKMIPLGLINRRATKHMRYLTKKSDKICKLCFRGVNDLVVNASVLEDTIDADFEGHLMRIPKDYSGYLKGCYGDYMKLPEESQQHPTHDIVEIKL